jgi:hypothetical protein
LPGGGRPQHLDRAGGLVELGVLDHQHGISAARQHGAGRDHGRGPGGHRLAGLDAGREDLGVEPQGAGLVIAGTKSVLRPDREAVDVRAIEARHVDRRDHVLGEHPAAGLRERHALLAERCQRQMAMEAGDRLVAVDDLEELLLPGGAPDRREQPRGVIHGRHRGRRPARTARP